MISPATCANVSEQNPPSQLPSQLWREQHPFCPPAFLPLHPLPGERRPDARRGLSTADTLGTAKALRRSALAFRYLCSLQENRCAPNQHSSPPKAAGRPCQEAAEPGGAVGRAPWQSWPRPRAPTGLLGGRARSWEPEQFVWLVLAKQERGAFQLC